MAATCPRVPSLEIQTFERRLFRDAMSGENSVNKHAVALSYLCGRVHALRRVDYTCIALCFVDEMRAKYLKMLLTQPHAADTVNLVKQMLADQIPIEELTELLS